MKRRILLTSVTPLLRPNGVDVTRRAYSTFEECGFEFNEFGGIRSDFAILVNSQSLLVMQQAANRLREIQALEPDNSSKSFEDIVREIRPRWCQSPKQIMEFQKYLIDNRIKPLEEEVERLRVEKEQQDTLVSDSADGVQS